MIRTVFPADTQTVFQFPLTVRTGCRETAVRVDASGLTLELPLPHLAGPREDAPLYGAAAREAEDGFFLMETPDGLAGAALGRPGENPREAARRLYSALLERARHLTLRRVWNYIPSINATGADGQENYRAFNAGRHAAFQERFGENFSRELPAASALGIGGDRMALVFSAGATPARHFENPEQIPAFRYPEQWGKIPPSFARGTRVDGERETLWHLSGTAGIKGHATMGGASFEEQMRVTLHNVRLMLNLMEVPAGVAGRWRVFLRNADDLETCRRMFAEAFPADAAAENRVMFLRADICRSCLLVELEAAFSRSSAEA